jgi:hypothetical protein
MVPLVSAYSGYTTTSRKSCVMIRCVTRLCLSTGTGTVAGDSLVRVLYCALPAKLEFEPRSTPRSTRGVVYHDYAQKNRIDVTVPYVRRLHVD